MDWAIWIPLLVSIAAWIPETLRWLSSRNQSNAELANTIMDGGTKAVAAVTKVLDEYQEQNKELRAEIEAIKASRAKREEEILAERVSFNHEIAGLHRRIENDVLETAALKRTIDDLKAQQALDLKETILLREDVSVFKKAAKNVIHKLVGTLEDARNRGMDIKLPDFNGDLDKLGESVRGLVWPKGKPE